MSKPSMDKTVSFKIPEKLLEEYKKFCKENSISLSKRIRKFIERDLEIWRSKNGINRKT